jgi:hypothetical protein
MDVPSPKFSSAVGEDVENEEENNEIISCILHNDPMMLKEILNMSS